MLRTPKANPTRCQCGSCRICTDPISTNLSALAATGDRWKTAKLNNRGHGWGTVDVNPAIVGKRLPPTPKRAMRPAPDLDMFQNAMADLTNAIRQPWNDDAK